MRVKEKKLKRKDNRVPRDKIQKLADKAERKALRFIEPKKIEKNFNPASRLNHLGHNIHSLVRRLLKLRIPGERNSGDVGKSVRGGKVGVGNSKVSN